jgi:hypothetical protein
MRPNRTDPSMCSIRPATQSCQVRKKHRNNIMITTWSIMITATGSKSLQRHTTENQLAHGK